MGFKGKIEHRRVAFTGIRMFQPNWFYHHEKLDSFIGQMVEVTCSKQNFGSITIKLPNEELIEAKLTKVTSRNSKTLNDTDSHLREVIEIYQRALEAISESEISLDAGIPMKEIAKEALGEGKTVFLLNNQKIKENWREN